MTDTDAKKATDEYAEMTHDDFVRLVTELAEKDGAAIIITIPGIWEILSEHYNNDALDLWKIEREIEAGECGRAGCKPDGNHELAL